MNHLASFILRQRTRLAFAGETEEDGQGMVEYAFILVLVALVVIVTLIIVGNQTKNMWLNIQQGLAH